jgi:hypothetical protein
MLKKIALAAFTAVSLSALAQTSTNNNASQSTMTTQTTASTNPYWENSANDGDMSWRQKYDTYAIASVDVNNIPMTDQYRVLRHELKSIPAGKAFTLTNFLLKSPGDQEQVLLKALVVNFKQASAVRDEVAQSRYGTYADYAWMNYPALTWSDTPGQNSWTSIPNFGSDTMTMTNSGDSSLNEQIAMTEDNSRPMRMVMSHKGWRDIGYDRALDILGAGLSENERGVLHTIFMPRVESAASFNSEGNYTNEDVLDAAICLINSNASMVDGLTRYGWYSHFNPHYYESNHWSW